MKRYEFKELCKLYDLERLHKCEGFESTIFETCKLSLTSRNLGLLFRACKNLKVLVCFLLFFLIFFICFEGMKPQTQAQCFGKPSGLMRRQSTQSNPIKVCPNAEADVQWCNVQLKPDATYPRLLILTKFMIITSKSADHSSRALARKLRLWVRIPLKAWMYVCVYSVFVSSCV
jgi:hypothetical protein